MNKLRCVGFVLMSVLLFFSCKDQETPVTMLSVEVSFPDELGGVNKDGVSLSLINQNSGKVYDGLTGTEGEWEIEIPEGVYNVSAFAEKEYTTIAGSESFTTTANLVGTQENLSIVGKSQSLSLELSVSINSNTWVFKELYFTGSRTPEDKSYRSDKYFSIVNNSDEVLYADGISLSESHVLTSSDVYDWESIVSRDEAFVVNHIYTIPGDGTTYPVQPGETIILADLGIDHTTENPNSFDLTMADFEWWDDHSLDSDVPEVENLIKSYSSSKTIWTPHNRGLKSYIIFKQEGAMDDFLTNNVIEGQTAIGKPLIRYKVPNDVIIDAVEMSTPSSFSLKVISPALDASYTHCGDEGDERYGKCVRRKVAREVNGRKVYMDTNNSAVDFETTVTPMPGL
ncbi:MULTISPECIES: DUF4876 domain-containing protein [unclassified Saccharicrinis]|uniref:DUF4876 domain-containing protein n=1 Tax=unclassified Saccharicrinis TaxID=2646859 RepID=UPI003D33E6E4